MNETTFLYSPPEVSDIDINEIYQYEQISLETVPLFVENKIPIYQNIVANFNPSGLLLIKSVDYGNMFLN